MLIVFDLDGVINLGNTPIPGAVETLHRLEAEGYRLAFLTNNSTRRRAEYVARITALGFPAREEQIMTSAYATALHLRADGAAGRTVFVVGEEGLRAELREAGLRVLDEDDPDAADYVVAGLDRTLTYARLLRAHREIVEHGARFIATNRDATYPTERGTIPGGGCIVAPIECSTGVRALTIGKPEPAVWLTLLQEYGEPPRNAVMVGDRPDTDIRGAKGVGLRTVLVLTGVTGPERVPTLTSEERPDAVLPDLRPLPELLDRWREEPE